LRAAQAYILISMPTGTSTIFGVFQAIWALPYQSGRTSALTYKLPRNEKFASEIFGRKTAEFLAATQKEITYLCE
jgi:peptidoglycan hydrolase-like protein with peptidoglycan-binding domain